VAVLVVEVGEGAVVVVALVVVVGVVEDQHL